MSGWARCSAARTGPGTSAPAGRPPTQPRPDGAVRYPGPMSTDSRPGRAQDARQASPVPGKPSLDGIEEKWSRRWEEAGVVHV